MSIRRRLWARALTALMIAATPALAIDIPVVYLKQVRDAPPVLSNLDPLPEDLGLAGAEVGLADNKTTGGFMGHNYTLEMAVVPVGDDIAKAAEEALARSPFLILDVQGADVTAIADLPAAQSALLFNAADPSPALRGEDCRTNVFHTLPSLTMRADALMQFIRFKKWDKLALIEGTHAGDLAWSKAMTDSATKFGLKIRKSKTWAFDADMRRNAAQEVPLFTQELGDYDLLLVADELNDFARYIPMNTWLPRPVAGSEGLVPTTWSRVVEQWGAAQLQSRFHEHAARDMRPQDYAAWAAIRTVGEAVTRTGGNDPKALRDYILSENFELAAFKGRPLSFRTWNGQMRQPIPLVTQTALVAQAPLPGYLHQRTELDTLGTDQPESTCKAFQ
ncbi:ABC transporter substrate-binding protein [Actibacterium pelagium]|uniref:Branched-chain amino acid ABC transporter substrate-binding protein n=1 Tax=Actibacterium pelagium TaxID=2029103 RepID=A0A917AHT9_9RHOB|nr:ABC transporter substrate-binding protein [Actibacterium pelagium]GGE54746.1 branched-chain amino acid ABC transporter substrate-binding protein [Actibacterium pelagium]